MKFKLWKKDQMFEKRLENSKNFFKAWILNETKTIFNLKNYTKKNVQKKSQNITLKKNPTYVKKKQKILPHDPKRKTPKVGKASKFMKL